jgi:hypothetical protein
MGVLMFRRLLLARFLLLASVAWSQSGPPQSSEPSMPGMDMSQHDMSNMKGMPMADDKNKDEEKDDGTSAHVMQSMEGQMDMGPHMKMTALRPTRSGDAARAQQVVEAARQSAEKYTDYHAALAEGFKIFLPNVPQKVYHFTSRANAIEAELHFNPSTRLRSSTKSMATITS